MSSRRAEIATSGPAAQPLTTPASAGAPSATCRGRRIDAEVRRDLRSCRRSTPGGRAPRQSPSTVTGPVIGGRPPLHCSPRSSRAPQAVQHGEADRPRPAGALDRQQETSPMVCGPTPSPLAQGPAWRRPSAMGLAGGGRRANPLDALRRSAASACLRGTMIDLKAHCPTIGQAVERVRTSSWSSRSDWIQPRPASMCCDAPSMYGFDLGRMFGLDEILPLHQRADADLQAWWLVAMACCCSSSSAASMSGRATRKCCSPTGVDPVRGESPTRLAARRTDARPVGLFVPMAIFEFVRRCDEHGEW